MDENFKTSAGQLSEPGGKGGGSVPKQYGDEPTGAPAPVTEPIKGEIMKKGIPTISQTERHLPEGK